MKEYDPREVLERKLLALFPDPVSRSKARHILDTYGVESREQEPDRVRLAILKLSGASLEHLQQTTRYAKGDFRDILTWAESPNFAKSFTAKGQAKKDKLRQMDDKQYEDWLIE